MAKRTTKADVILKEAEERIAKAAVVVDGLQGEFNDAESQLDRARAILAVHQSTFIALQKSLAREPSAAPKVKKTRSDKGTKRGLPNEAAKANGGDGSDQLLDG